MKKIFSALAGIILLLSCVEEKKSTNKIFNPFEVNVNEQIQIFDLDTIQLKEITGKLGTKIYFDRNSFNVKGSDKITLELKELYNIQDLIKNNIRTLTENNDLLESSGVIFLNFKRNGEDINLAGNSRIQVRFPVKFSNQDKLFSGEMDSTGQMSWSESESYFTVLRFDKQYQIDMPHDVTLDSLPYYQELWRIQDSIYEKTIGRYDRIEKKVGTSLSFNKLGWINIDKFVESPTKTDFNLTNSLDMEGLVIYALYEDLDSFISFYPDETNNIILTDVPVVDKTFLIAVGTKDGQLFGQKLFVGENKSLELSLKELNQSELNKLFEK